MPKLEEFRAYARIGEEEPDEVVRLYLDGAIQHAKDAGIPDFLSEIEDPKYNLYVYAMGAYLYDNRGFELSSGNAGGALNNLKIQMRRELMLRRKRTEETT